METKVILKYRRESDRWICPECDTENSMVCGNCSVCGSVKSPSAFILKQWTEADDRPAPPPRKRVASQTGTSVFKYTEERRYIPEEKDNTTKVVLWLLAALIFIIILVAMGAENSYAATLSQMSGLEEISSNQNYIGEVINIIKS